MVWGTMAKMLTAEAKECQQDMTTGCVFEDELSLYSGTIGGHTTDELVVGCLWKLNWA